MAIRLTLISFLSAGLALASPIQRYPLDDGRVYPLTISATVPTTVMFTGPIDAIDGAGMSERVEDAPGILFSHQPGTQYFSMRALQPEAQGAVNVMYQGRIYALALQSGDDPVRSLSFVASPDADTASHRSRTADLLTLLDRTRHAAELRQHHPALMQDVQRVLPATVTEEDGLRITITEAFRFIAQEALVLKIRLENFSQADRHYDPAELRVQIAGRLFPIAITDATGVIPAGYQDTLLVAVTHAADGTPARLSLHNQFRLILPVRA